MKKEDSWATRSTESGAPLETQLWRILAFDKRLFLTSSATTTRNGIAKTTAPMILLLKYSGPDRSKTIGSRVIPSPQTINMKEGMWNRTIDLLPERCPSSMWDRHALQQGMLVVVVTPPLPGRSEVYSCRQLSIPI
jgi:hypothetical protein